MPYVIDPLLLLGLAAVLVFAGYYASRSRKLTASKLDADIRKEQFRQAKVAFNEELMPDGLSAGRLKEIRSAAALKQIDVEGDVYKAAQLSGIHLKELQGEDALAVEAAQRRDQYEREKARLDGPAEARRRKEALPGHGGPGQGGGQPPPGPEGGDGKASRRHRKP